LLDLLVIYGKEITKAARPWAYFSFIIVNIVGKLNKLKKKKITNFKSSEA